VDLERPPAGTIVPAFNASVRHVPPPPARVRNVQHLEPVAFDRRSKSRARTGPPETAASGLSRRAPRSARRSADGHDALLRPDSCDGSGPTRRASPGGGGDRRRRLHGWGRRSRRRRPRPASPESGWRPARQSRALNRFALARDTPRRAFDLARTKTARWTAYFEDFFRSRSRLRPRAATISRRGSDSPLRRRYDPQPFHLGNEGKPLGPACSESSS